MVLKPVHCPNCDTINVIRGEKTTEGKECYLCRQDESFRWTLIPRVLKIICNPVIRIKINS
ncbi:hypothetical protein LC607_24800 [Nostoc sp. CHAB 5824]|nr:hypothetical protein [Nostoc sp. CHAB 5824]